MSEAKDPDRSAEIEALIAEFQRSAMRELHVRSDGFELYLSNDSGTAGIVRVEDAAPATAPSPAAATPVATVVPTTVPDGATVVLAPYLGTFYRAPKPGSPAYVEIGSAVTAETEICLVEVMKLFTAVRAEVAGRIVAILATDGQMVQADQPLFAIAAG